MTTPHEMGNDIFATLFSEELALVFEVSDTNLKSIQKSLKEFGFEFDTNAFILGKTTQTHDIVIIHKSKESCICN